MTKTYVQNDIGDERLFAGGWYFGGHVYRNRQNISREMDIMFIFILKQALVSYNRTDELCARDVNTKQPGE